MQLVSTSVFFNPASDAGVPIQRKEFSEISDSLPMAPISINICKCLTLKGKNSYLYNNYIFFL